MTGKAGRQLSKLHDAADVPPSLSDHTVSICHMQGPTDSAAHHAPRCATCLLLVPIHTKVYFERFLRVMQLEHGAQYFKTYPHNRPATYALVMKKMFARQLYCSAYKLRSIQPGEVSCWQLSATHATIAD